MAGLVGYDSSDDDSDGREEPQVQTPPKGKDVSQNTTNGAAPVKGEEKPRPIVVENEQKSESPTDRPRIGGPLPAASSGATDGEAAERAPGPALGPSLGPAQGPSLGPAPGDDVFGPSRPPTLDELPEEDDNGMGDDYGANVDPNEPPLSPYSAERAAVRQLTMPSVPDFDIPGSPDPDAAATSVAALAALNKKFATFLELKQKKDTHFNARLAQSDAMKNPALMDKLMAFVGMPGNAWGGSDPDADEEGGGGGGSITLKGKQKADKPVDTTLVSAQYGTTLPLELWDPAAFPPEAYRRSLRRLQEDAAKQRARAPGERVDFVSSVASTSSTPGISGGQDGSQQTSRSGTPGTSTTTGKRKTRFD